MTLLKLKFKTSIGDVIAIGTSVGVAKPDETVEDYTGYIPRNISYYRRVSQNNVQKKTVEEVQEIDRKKSKATKEKIDDKLKLNTKNLEELVMLIAQKVGITNEEIENL